MLRPFTVMDVFELLIDDKFVRTLDVAFPLEKSVIIDEAERLPEARDKLWPDWRRRHCGRKQARQALSTTFITSIQSRSHRHN